MNDVFGIILSLLGSDLPLYIEVGQVHGGLGSLAYGLYASESRRVLQWHRVDLGIVMEPKKPSVSSDYSFLTP
jgi:hypothetical protein